MNAGEVLVAILAVLLVVGILGGAIALLIGSALFLIGLGVPGLLVWGWVAFFIVSGTLSALAAAN